LSTSYGRSCRTPSVGRNLRGGCSSRCRWPELSSSSWRAEQRCGFRGGPIFPAIFLGTAVTTLAVVALDVSPTLAVAVGTAAGMAAMTRLLFSALVFSVLLVGDSGLDAVPAAALAAVAAWLMVMALDKRAARTPGPGAGGAGERA